MWGYEEEPAPRWAAEGAIGEAVAAAFYQIRAARTRQAPTLAIVDRAVRLLADGRLSPTIPASAIRYDHDGAAGERCSVVVSFDGRGYIDLAHSLCTCDAGRAERVCAHLLAALADACAHFGYEIERPC